MSRFPAIYFDGNVAADRPVSAETAASALVFSGTDVRPQSWRLNDLQAVDRPAAGRPLRLTHAGQPGARLIIADEAAKSELLRLAPQLAGGVSYARAGRLIGAVAGGLLLLLAVAYAVVQTMPQRIAFMLPDGWREQAGEQLEKSMVDGAKRCDAAAAGKALSALMARLAEGSAEFPAVSVRVYDIPVMNAFALPGGHIVVTAELIKKAGAPEELAGVIAHELGHVSMRHSEAQIVRATGLQLLLAIASGGNGGDTLSNLAGLATILRYSRAAEADADDYAVKMMTAAAIDPLGLKHFFERIVAEDGKKPEGRFGNIESVFATHPGTAERIGKIGPLPPGVTARPVMSEEQWQALKAICSG